MKSFLLRRAAWVCLGVVFPAHLWAASEFCLDLGAYGDNLAQRLAASPTYVGEVATLAGFARMRPIFHLAKAVSFEPSFSFVLPWRSSGDGFAKRFTTFFGLDFGWNLARWLKWRMGTAAQMNFIWGKGTAVELNNGLGTTTFYSPEGITGGFVLLVESGIELRLASSVSLGVDLYVSQVANTANRRFMGMAYLGIYL